jgi:hypothetical protein
MSLPDGWIDRIFTKLTLTYGQAFLRQYDGVEMADVKANWGHELACFQQSPDAIRHGLEHLPERPPNIVQFRDLCRIPVKPVLLTNDLPPVDPKMAALVKDALSKAERRIGDREWAERLKSKELAGARLTQYQRACWREALGGQQ